jgi:hypothetical protein
MTAKNFRQADSSRGRNLKNATRMTVKVPHSEVKEQLGAEKESKKETR